MTQGMRVMTLSWLAGQMLSDRAVYALCFAVLATISAVVAMVGLFEDTIDSVLIGGLKGSSNPVLENFGWIIWVLAVIGWGLQIYISPWVFLSISGLLAVMAGYFYITRSR